MRGASGTTPYGEPIPTGPRGIEDPAEAHRRANDAFSRFQRALEQGTPAVESFRSLILPALDLLRRAQLQQEARELEQRARDYIERHTAELSAQEVLSRDDAGTRIDVFISYTAADWSWANWIDFVLREAGYTTKVQGYDFVLGKSFVHAMETRSNNVAGLRVFCHLRISSPGGVVRSGMRLYTKANCLPSASLTVTPRDYRVARIPGFGWRLRGQGAGTHPT